MAGFCGWSGVALPDQEARQTLNAMTAHAHCTDDGAQTLVAGEASLALWGDTVCADLNDIRAVLTGTPRWEDRDLAELARQYGSARALIEAWLRHDRNCLSCLRGPFAFAIVRGSSALIAIDRMGIHALSFALVDRALVFATDSAAVAAHPLVGREIAPQGLFNFLYFHVVPSPGSIYRRVEKLLPAQYVHFSDGHLERGFYWALPYQDHADGCFDTQARHFRELLRQAVDRVAPDEPTGTFLSGGTDSSTVCGLLSELGGKPVASYSIGYDVEEFDEIRYARIAARRFGSHLRERLLQPEDILSAIPIIAQHYDEPFANDSAVPVYHCARHAVTDGVGTLLAGDGGDELFGGNARYAKQLSFELYKKIPTALRAGVIEPMLLKLPGIGNLPLLRKGRSYVRQANTPLPDRMESYNFLYRQPLEDVFESDFLATVETGQPEEWLREAYFRAASEHPVNRMLHLDMKFTLADNDLRKVSRMCEAAGVKVHYPLLDEDLAEFSAELPPDYKVRGQHLRWFFKQALRDFLPREIIHKTKHGFGLPFGVWSLTHAPLKELVDDSLSSFERRGILRPAYIRELRRQHATVHPTYFGKMVWVLLTLEQWLQAHEQP